jgi:endonuclease/exonuclease/phosphatase family metal-dependent hydrolase
MLDHPCQIPDLRSGVPERSCVRARQHSRPPVARVTFVMRHLDRISLATLLLALVGCRGGTNYHSPLGPRYGAPAPACPSGRVGGELRIVTYNVAFSRKVDEAIRVLRDVPDLAGADVVLLQEMTADATARIATALAMGYVHYPAIHHRRAKQDFGNAVLSRWPIERDEKLVLPHRSRYAGTQRAATIATIRVDTLTIRVYSTHLGTAADISARRRLQQLDTILRDAARFPVAVVGGDMNSADIGPTVRANGFLWPTHGLPKTARFGRWDHVLVRGGALAMPARAGTVEAGRSASDHDAVWVRIPIRARLPLQPSQDCARRVPGTLAPPATSGAPT